MAQEVPTQVQDNEIVFNDRLMKCISDVTKWGIGFGIVMLIIFIFWFYIFIMGIRYFSFRSEFIWVIVPIFIFAGIVSGIYKYLTNVKKGMADREDRILVEAFRGLEMVVLYCLVGVCVTVLISLFMIWISFIDFK